MAKLVHEQWTARGSDPASLAHRYMDGTVDALDSYVMMPHDGQAAVCNSESLARAAALL